MLPANRRRPAARDIELIWGDLVDSARRLALEADSWEFHGSEVMFQRDCWRCTALVADGWTVLRFTWWQVMHDPGWVLACLREVAGRGQACLAFETSPRVGGSRS